MNSVTRCSLGIDQLLRSGRLTGQRVGLVCNPASVDASFRHSADRIYDAEGVTLTALFGPQHGFRSDVQDNMVETSHARHPRFDIPIFSLYGERREPTAEMLKELDVIVIDMQDVGTRVYTYIYTMANCLRTAARHAIPVVVCDRPNPIGGTLVEGPQLETGYESFVGQFPIPLRHGMTIGELSRLFNDTIRAELEVAELEGWNRDDYHDETALPWIMPSPNVPTLESAAVYPGTVLLEGTNLSEGRGTTRPFELVGAPWIDGDALTRTLENTPLDGVMLRPTHFEPTFQKHVGTPCGGCQIHVTNRRAFRPVLTAVTLIQTMKRLDPHRFAWREPPYEYETVKPPIDILSGSATLREQLDAGTPAPEIAALWQRGVETFLETRRAFLLY